MIEAGLPTNLSGISSTLQGQFYDWVEARKPQEEEFVRCYNDNMRIWRDDDTKEVGTSKAQKSRVFVGSTRGKIRSARAKIKDSLFGAGQLPFDTNPTNEKLKGYADTMEAILKYQLEEGKFKEMLGTGVDSLATYGTGFIFGPFVKNKSHTSVDLDDSFVGKILGAIGKPRMKETTFSYDCPYYEHAPSLDVYPDPMAEDVLEGKGVYWASRKSPEFLRELKTQKGYSKEAIDRALQERISGTTSEGTDRTKDSRMNMYRWTPDGRIWFVRYFGLVSKKQLSVWQTDYMASAPSDADDDLVEAIVIMAGGYVIKADPNPYKEQRRPCRRAVYEAVEHEMYGVGIAKNNDPNQRTINAAFRLFIEGKAFALLKQCSIDRSKFEAGEDFKFFPGKRFMMRPGLTPEERQAAIIWHDTQDVTAGWETLIELSERFSDDDTAITKYTQGGDSEDLNKTATGISMIMNASALPLKEVLSNIDEMWIEDMIEGLIDWNMEHLEPETVKAIIGDKEAQMWGEIKEYGKTNFMEWFATGSKTFMTKEVLMNKLNGFLQLVSANPMLASLVDMRELLEQVWNAGQIGGESPVYDEETLKQNQSQGPQQQAMQQAQQAIGEIKQQASEAIKQAQDMATKAQQQADDAKRNDAVQMAKMAADQKNKDQEFELKKIAALQAHSNAGVVAAEANARIDKLEADTVAALAAANERPDPELEAAATSKRGEETQQVMAPLLDMHKELIGKIDESHQLMAKAMKPKKRVLKRGPDGQKYSEEVET